MTRKEQERQLMRTARIIDVAEDNDCFGLHTAEQTGVEVRWLSLGLICLAFAAGAYVGVVFG